MRLLAIFAAALLPLLSLSGCNDLCGDKECLFTETEWDVAHTLSPLPDPTPDPTNQYVQSEAAAALGKKLLHETRYSTALKVGSTLGAVGDTGKVACISCHLAPTFHDTRSNPSNLSVGVSWTVRNAPSLVNQVYYDWHNWIGSRRTLWEQAAFSPETGTNTAGDRCTYAHMLWDHYRDEYNAVFTDYPLTERLSATTTDPVPIPAKCKPSANPSTSPGAWEMMSGADKDIIVRIMANQGKAVAAFESRLISRNAPFDAYMAGNRQAISLSAKRGLQHFLGKAACVNCHRGPFFTDQSFHALGVAQSGPNVLPTDQGRMEGINDILKSPVKANGPYSDDPSVTWIDGLTQDDASTRGKFRTPSLRNVALTPPYMHDGSLATLRDVVSFYNRGGESGGFLGDKDPRMVPLGLTEGEIDEVVAFLETLTGDPISDELAAPPQLPQ